MSYRLIQASAHETGLPDKSVHMICCSPPYYGLRMYSGEQSIEWPEVSYSPMPGLPPMTIAGCKPGCVHEWAEDNLIRRSNDSGKSPKQASNNGANGRDVPIPRSYCLHCGGWRGGLGAEPTPEMFIGHLILVMREMWRVLRDDGAAFINLGDSYIGSANTGGSGKRADGGTPYKIEHLQPKRGNGLKPKDLMLIPYRFALAAQADGWYVRSDIIWHKPNPMPESVTDRPTKSHEYIYLLSKSPDYFYDGDAVREITGKEADPEEYKSTQRRRDDPEGYGMGNNGNSAGLYGKRFTHPAGRNRRSVWTVATSPYPGSHFATFPPALVEPMIKAGTSEHGVCAACGSPWERVISATKYEPEIVPVGVRMVDDSRGDKIRKLNGKSAEWREAQASKVTTGWQPTCTCSAALAPATVLDPFNGSGTTGRAAMQLGRSYIGVDISKDYLDNLCADDNRAAAGLPKLLKGNDNDFSSMPLWAEATP